MNRDANYGFSPGSPHVSFSFCSYRYVDSEEDEEEENSAQETTVLARSPRLLLLKAVTFVVLDEYWPVFYFFSNCLSP